MTFDAIKVHFLSWMPCAALTSAQFVRSAIRLASGSNECKQFGFCDASPWKRPQSSRTEKGIRWRRVSMGTGWFRCNLWAENWQYPPISCLCSSWNVISIRSCFQEISCSARHLSLGSPFAWWELWEALRYAVLQAWADLHSTSVKHEWISEFVSKKFLRSLQNIAIKSWKQDYLALRFAEFLWWLAMTLHPHDTSSSSAVSSSAQNIRQASQACLLAIKIGLQEFYLRWMKFKYGKSCLSTVSWGIFGSWPAPSIKHRSWLSKCRSHNMGGSPWSCPRSTKWAKE